MDSSWQKEWPTEPGYWWLYGWCSRKSNLEEREEKPQYHLVVIRKVNNGTMSVTEGRLLYPQEGTEGMWLKCKFPDPPKEVKPR